MLARYILHERDGIDVRKKHNDEVTKLLEVLVSHVFSNHTA